MYRSVALGINPEFFKPVHFIEKNGRTFHPFAAVQTHCLTKPHNISEKIVHIRRNYDILWGNISKLQPASHITL